MINYKVPKYKIEIGSHPRNESCNKDIDMNKYETVINVSDAPPYRNLAIHPDSGIFQDILYQEVHWYPINEFGYWGYGPFYFIVHLLDKAISNENTVYVHCWAGAHRSPLIVYMYLRSLGHTPEEAFALVDDFPSIIGDKKSNWLEEILINDINAGRIPEDAIQFMIDARKWSDSTMMSVMKNRRKIDFPNPHTVKVTKIMPVTKNQIDNGIKF